MFLLPISIKISSFLPTCRWWKFSIFFSNFFTRILAEIWLFHQSIKCFILFLPFRRSKYTSKNILEHLKRLKPTQTGLFWTSKCKNRTKNGHFQKLAMRDLPKSENFSFSCFSGLFGTQATTFWSSEHDSTISSHYERAYLAPSCALGSRNFTIRIEVFGQDTWI